MKKRILSILLAMSCITALVVAVPVLAASPSNQGFESNTGDWVVNKTINRVPSGGGTLGLPASSGGYYAEITNLDNGYTDGTLVGDAGYSYYGAGSGGNSVYNGAFYQSIDVYIDPNWAPATQPGYASFWIDMTPYHADPNNYGAEHNFHLKALGSSVTISVDGDGSPMATITSSGWYSFVMTYSKDANPANPVITNMMVYHANTLNQVGTTATTYANSPGGPFPSSALAGNGYVWLTVWQNGFANDTLGIDNVNTGLLPYEVVTPPPAPPTAGTVSVTGNVTAATVAIAYTGNPALIGFGMFNELRNPSSGWASTGSNYGTVTVTPGSDASPSWTVNAFSEDDNSGLFANGMMYCTALTRYLDQAMYVDFSIDGGATWGTYGQLHTGTSVGGTNLSQNFWLGAAQNVSHADVVAGQGDYYIYVQLSAGVTP